MINSKQRAWLRSQANQLACQFHVGKGAITPQLLQGLDEILSTHELMKVSILKTAEGEPGDLAVELAGAVGADVIQVIGRRFVLYRHSDKLAEAGKDLQFPRNI
jgi:RNA-binding protein